MVVLRAKGFLLRPYRLSDAPSLQKHINDKTVYDGTLRIPHPYTIVQALEFIQWTHHTKELSLAIAIDGKVVGGIGLHDITHKRGELGYWLGKEFRRQGIMSAAVKLVVVHAFRKLRLQRIQATVFPKNKASIRLLNKAGFKKEGLLRGYTSKDGKQRDVLIFSLLAPRHR